MRSIVWILFMWMIHLSYSACPKATFEFSNNTVTLPYTFIDSPVGNIGSLETCPYTGRPYVYLPCYPNSSWGNAPYFSTCLQSPETKQYFEIPIEQIAKLPMNNSVQVSRIISYLNNENFVLNNSLDVISAVDIIDRIMINPYLSTREPIIYSIVDKILSSKSIYQAQKVNHSITKLLSSLDVYSQSFQMKTRDENIRHKNLRLSIVNQPIINRQKPIIGFIFDSNKNQTSSIDSKDRLENSTSITLDSQVLSQQNRLVFSVFNSDNGLFDDEQYRVLTRIISLTIDKPDLIVQMNSSVEINFVLEQNQTNANLTCAFWKIYSNRTAQWSTDGCQLINIYDRNVRCRCNHLTHFAILMNMKQESIPKLIQQIMSMITVTGLFLSSIGLSLTILTFILFKKLRRHFSQKSLLLLSINLLFVNLLFSIIDFYQFNNLACTIFASLLHYFVLSSFSWMFVMAFIQYLLFVKIFPKTISAFTIKAAIFAQSVPLIPICVILILDPRVYTKRADKICWLSTAEYPLYLSFILPILLYILINGILFSFVAYALLCSRTSQQMRSTQVIESQRLSRFLIALSCFVVLGLTWSFGLFSIGPMRFIFQILFCLFASLTGFFIFILYIVTSKAKRTCWTNTFKNLGISTISTTSGLIGTKEFSTTSTNDQHQQRVPSRLVQFPSQPKHFIDAYMPPPPPLPLPASFLIEGDDPLNPRMLVNNFYESKHISVLQTNQPTTSLDDYSLFYAANHGATKL